MPTNATPARKEQRATGSAQYPIHPGHKVTHFPEQQKVQLFVITTVLDDSLQGDTEVDTHIRLGNIHTCSTTILKLEAKNLPEDRITYKIHHFHLIYRILIIS